MEYTRIIENLVLTSTLRLEGEAWDNTLIRNVTIIGVEGDGIFLRDVSNVRIENVTIADVTGNGVKLSTTGSTENVTIVDSSITGTGLNGIFAGEAAGVGHSGLTISGNTISDTGLAGVGSGLLHGLYLQSAGFVVSGNTILNSAGGNGISVRSSGEIEGNHVVDAYKSGIAYYADHPAGSGTLVIEGNEISDVGQDGARGAINLLEIPAGADVVAGIVVRDNVVTGTGGVVVDADYAAAGIVVETGSVAVPEQAFVPAEEPAGPQSGFALSAGAGNATTVDLYLDAWTDETTAARQKLSAVQLDEIGVRIRATQDGAAASVGIDSGHIGVMSTGETVAKASWIDGDEALIFDFSKAAVDVSEVTLSLLDGGTVVLTGYRDGVAVGEVTQSGTTVTFGDEVGFDTLVLTSGPGASGVAVTGLAATWTYQDDGYLL